MPFPLATTDSPDAALDTPSASNALINPAPKLPATITREQAARAFAYWENETRNNPSKFYTADEAAQMEVCSLSEGRAICLFAYARQAAV